ncbi:C40 family peptidase [Bacillus haynesii]|uniref:C40 family peptidase n=1 Tax=Bacillus haynesii TaxID=1925021 RepID=UPI00227E1D50|nr:C40 family peptidase [Bacillus haynesii]MCY7754174.1 C40 family peptidase [Bacillus haynesii]MCY8001511.1 C40 family peptidase [Bacillus haynesii]MEC1532004.1 C40 family peptidase [Bacillus haynesii]
MSLYTTAVSVANVWTSPEAPRRIDRMMLANPVRVRSWLDGLSYEERLELCTANLVQTQVLFGEDVQLLQERGDWAFAIIPGQPSAKDERGYPGWIPKDCLVEKSPAKSEACAVIQKPTAFLYDDKKTRILELSFLTKLPVLSSNGIWFEVDTPLGRKWLKKGDADLETPVKGSGDDIVQTGQAFLNLPYLWGGMSGFGYDCSGFVFNMLKANGHSAPRDASDQAKGGKEVSFSSPKRGDLLFFAYEEGRGRVHHVGIYCGNGQMLHSPKTGKSIEVIPLKGTIYEKELCAIRRYF